MPGVSPTQDLSGKDLFPERLNYHPDFLSHKEEQALLRHIERLPFKEFEFHGFSSKRRTVSFGWRYDNGGDFSRKPSVFIPQCTERNA